MRRVVAALLVLAAMGIGARFLLRDRGGPESATDAERRSDDAPPARAQVPGPGLQTASVAGAPRGRCAIAGTVLRGEKPTAARVEVAFVSEAKSDRAAGPGTTTYLERLLSAPKPASGAVATTSDADGRFLVEGLSPGSWRVTATATDGAQGGVAATLAADGARTDARVEIGLGVETLSGRVVYADGRPFAGVVYVGAGPKDHAPLDMSPGAPVAIDENGRFLATGLARGEVILHAIESGRFRAVSSPVAIPHAGVYVFVVDAGLLLRNGRVVADEDGTPIAGARVLGGGTAEGRLVSVAGTTTNAQGRFEIRLPRAGGGLRVVAPGFRPVRKDLKDLRLGDALVEFRLPRGTGLAGRVTSAADKSPVAGVSIRVIPQTRGTSFFPPEPTTTDADGRYVVMGLEPGEVLAFAEGAGWVTKGLAEINEFGRNPFKVLLKAGETVACDFEVVRAVSAEGIVLDADGKPVVGAVVKAEGRRGEGSYWWLGALENASSEARATGPDGTFVLDGLIGGANYLLTATAQDGQVAHASRLASGEASSARVEIRFVAARPFDVVVLDDETGRPIPDASVSAEVESPLVVARPRESVKTGPDGTAHLVLDAPGHVRLDVDADGYAVQFPVRVPSTVSAYTVRLHRGFLVTGRVVLPDGSPAEGADIEARLEEGIVGDPNFFGATAGKGGTFSMTFRSPGERTIHATFHAGAQALEADGVATAGGEAIVLTLAPKSQRKPAPGALVVHVLDPDGKPVPAAHARLEVENGWEREVVDGDVEFGAKGRSEAWISVWDAATKDGSPLPLGPARVGPVAAVTNEVEVRLPPERRIEGFVRGPDGKGVRGVRVWARWGGVVRGSHSFMSEDGSDGEGAFRLGRLGSEDCSIFADVPPEYVAPDEVKTPSGTTGVELRLRAATIVKITVLDAEGHLLPGADVRAQREDRGWIGLHAWTTTDGDGVARLGGLEPSTIYDLDVFPRSHGALLAHSNPAWKAADTTVRLERDHEVRGVVKDLSGRPIAGAQVAASSDANGRDIADTDENGAFSMSGFPAGEVTLRASFGGSFDDAGPEVRVAAGTLDVVLTLDRGVELRVRVDPWPAGDDDDHNAHLFRQDRQGQSSLGAAIGPDGVIRFRGLSSGQSYTLWIPPITGDRSLLQRDVRAGPTELHVSLVPGKSITGRIVLPPGVEHPWVTASRDNGMIYVAGTTKPDGTFEIRGLPDGLWRVEASVITATALIRGDGNAPAGGSVDLVLK